MSTKTVNGPEQSSPAENPICESWTLWQAATWIQFRDFDRAQRAYGNSLLRSGFYASQNDANFPKRRKGESDAQINHRMEEYHQDRRLAKEIEGLNWSSVQNKLIEALANSEVRSISLRDGAATISSDAWKAKLITFPGPSYVRVFSDEVMRRWKPIRVEVSADDQTRKPNKRHGGWDYKLSDEPLVVEAANGVKSGTYLSAWAAALHFALRAKGGGTPDSKAKRLVSKIKMKLDDLPL